MTAPAAPVSHPLHARDWWPELVACRNDYSLRELSERFGATPSAIMDALKEAGQTRTPQPGSDTVDPVGGSADLVQPQASPADIHPFSDGRLFNPDTVAREINFHTENMLVSAFEIGKRLVWAKAVLGHGRFGEWADANFAFSNRTRQRYMKVAARLQNHPKLLEPLSQAGLKKTLLLTSLAEDELTELADEGALGEVDLSQISDVSYVELNEMVKRERTRREQAERTAADATGKLERTEKRLQETEAQVAKLSGHLPPEQEQEVLDHLAKMRQRFDALMVSSGIALDGFARMAEDMSPGARAALVGFVEYRRVFVEYEQERFRSLSGEFVEGAVFAELENRPRPMGDLYELPEARRLPDFGDDA